MPSVLLSPRSALSHRGFSSGPQSATVNAGRRRAIKVTAGLLVVVAVVVLVIREASNDNDVIGINGAGTIVMEDYRFTPNRIDAKVGVSLTVTLINKGTMRHDLNFQSIHMPGRLGVESILDPGQTRTITLLFDAPGTHTFICSLPGHAAAGMTGAAYVTP